MTQTNARALVEGFIDKDNRKEIVFRKECQSLIKVQEAVELAFDNSFD